MQEVLREVPVSHLYIELNIKLKNEGQYLEKNPAEILEKIEHQDIYFKKNNMKIVLTESQIQMLIKNEIKTNSIKTQEK